MSFNSEREKAQHFATAKEVASRVDSGDGPEDPADADPARQVPAVPSDYAIQTLEEYMQTEPVTEVYVCGRESGRKQNLPRQLKGTCRRIRRLGVQVVYAYGEIADGKSLDPDERPALHRAIAAARRRGVPLVLPCISRAARSLSYHAYHNPKEKPTVAEFERFMKLAEGVTILTLHDPDADPVSDEEFLRSLNAEMKRRKAGRRRKKVPGYTKEDRRRCEPRARQLSAEGFSLREIADALFAEFGIGVSHVRVRNWLKTPALNPR